MPALGSVAARVNTVPNLSATFSDPDASDTDPTSFQICSDVNCSTVLPSGSGSSASGIVNGASGTWSPPVTLSDGTTYYWRAEATDSPGTSPARSGTSSFVVDTTAPTVSDVTASNANGSYKAGQTIHVQVNFSEPVNVTGTRSSRSTPRRPSPPPTPPARGTSTLTFDYTVQAGDNAATLDYTRHQRAHPQRRHIADPAAQRRHPHARHPGRGRLARAPTRASPIDTTAPTVSSVTASNADGAYKAGQTIHVQVNFSEPVNVTGTPQLLLETGATDETANYASGSRHLDAHLRLHRPGRRHQRQTSTTTAPARSPSTAARSPTPAGNNATLTLATPGAAGSLGAKRTSSSTPPPDRRAVSAPADGSALNAAPSLSATFGNSDAGDTGSLDFDLCSDAACSGILQSSSPGGLTDGASRSWTPSSLAHGTYYWRVGAHDAVGNQSGWSATSKASRSTRRRRPGRPARLRPPVALLEPRARALAATLHRLHGRRPTPARSTSSSAPTMRLRDGHPRAATVAGTSPPARRAALDAT